MSAAEFEIVGSIHAAFAAAGLRADIGSYQATALSPILPVRGYVFRDIQQTGSDGQFIGRRDEVSLLIEDVAAPVRGAIVILLGSAFKLDALTDNDGSVSRWVALRV